MRKSAAHPRSKDWLVVIIMTLLLVVPMLFPLLSIQDIRPREPVTSSVPLFPSAEDRTQHPPTTENPSPLGYSLSLMIWLVPCAAIALWLRQGLKNRRLLRAVFWTMMLVGSLGLILDIGFGILFFTFPNRDAIIGPCLPAFTWGLCEETIRWDLIPIEEFFFYFFGALTIVLIYVWCDNYWLSAYNCKNEQITRARIARHIHWKKIHLPSTLFGLIVFLTGFTYRTFLNVHYEPQGFPGYLLFLTLVGILPSLLLFRFVQDLINYRALSVTLLTVLLISIFYEALLGVPYQWWGFREEQMVGIMIAGFSGVPIEEPLLWIAIVWACVIFFETIHTLQHVGWNASRKVIYLKIKKKLKRPS